MKLFSAFFAVLLLASCVTAKPAETQTNSNAPLLPVFDNLSEARLLLIREAAVFLGVPYASPPNIPHNFDCSGFVSHVFAQFGYNLPRTSSAYVNVGTRVAWEDVLPGDILIFSRTRGSSNVGHVAILWSKSENGALAGSWIIHAASVNTGRSMLYGNPNTRTGVVITELGLRGDGIVENEYFLQRFMYSVRVLDK